MEPEEDSGVLTCRGAVCDDASPEKAPASPLSNESGGEMLSGAALLTGQTVSHFVPSGDSGPGLLRMAVPVIDPEGRNPLVIEAVKRQRAAGPEEGDLLIIRTFGSLYQKGAYAPEEEPAESPPPAGSGVNGDASAAPDPDAHAPAEGERGPAVGRSSAFTRAQLLAAKAARSDVPVLILGETGTGKDMVARQLHDASRRRRKPFVAINCGALSDATLESEFFGHVRGAFTGAWRSRRGRLEEADGGTVFLDEIGEMTPSCQVKLLRTLDTGEITPLGGNKTSVLNVRFIAATNRNLEEMIQEGRFREDLFYRLQGMRIELPPLRRRRGDLELLAMHFFELEAALQESAVRGFSPQAMELLRNYGWPGNVRELRQAVASGVTMADGEWIEPRDLPITLASPRAGGRIDAPLVPPPMSLQDQERARIVEALRLTAYPATGRWNIRAAARHLDMNHQTLRYKIRNVYRLSQ